MARLEHRREGSQIVAETGEELRLLADALDRGRELPLREGLYPVSPHALAVPEGLSLTAAESLLRDFEAAALAHQRALELRRRFRSL